MNIVKWLVSMLVECKEWMSLSANIGNEYNMCVKM